MMLCADYRRSRHAAGITVMGFPREPVMRTVHVGEQGYRHLS